MSFSYQPVEQVSFQHINEVVKWVKSEEDNLVRVPISGCLDHGAQFLDDEHFGDEQTAFKFNEYGIRNLCSFLGLRLETLDLLERENLASEVLNDLLAQRLVQDRLKTQQLIIDESRNVILGIVSQSYLGYSNHHFIQNIMDLINPKTKQVHLFPDQSGFEFRGAYSVNTQLRLRFTMKNKVGVVKGLGGQGHDETEIGIQFRNSMVGDASVNINLYLYRKICANGLVASAGSDVNRVFHSGKEDSFNNRLKLAFDKVQHRIGPAGKMIEQLGALEFNPHHLAQTNRSEMIFSIIPGSKKEILSKCNVPNVPRKGNSTENRIEREAKIIGLIPDVFGRLHSNKVFKSYWRNNTSMFDFINIFTEYAKELTPQKRIAVEESAGVLADWINNNKRKFNTLGQE